ncbi:type IV pilus assembly protein PilM [Pseudomonas gessardii]|uniref:Type IV pilus assembly protein PilM n=1 Tax=Pseudomonas gessardii TaxID=78544 RepID=A0ABS9EYV4_9PSED|nr:type IV pilus assembly protein PilM [Pseudomonas gessardii]MCF4977017.1 type IV pilus assembly protein PilM [Pseudomonas gessardii]MCF4987993.1 type IV pilus assembly protein PilM [Pseudomonas gessardii]MCF5082998.1 type IV pilus assembly protein PilM [Pseudomonas gessardii]MCF5093449.1 type IV pilus assembly protein PilM [Pseudomonas gessardii]MCF5105391.1 type IV pilus assembly protein PilM [Pseudomonas gessardii]
MKKGFFRRKADTVLGVDIQDHGVQVLELARAGDGYAVRTYASQPLPGHAVLDSNIVDLEVVAQALSKALFRAQTQVRQAAVAVAGPSVISRVVALEAGLEAGEMERRLHCEAEQYIPYPLDEVAIDFQVQGPSGREPGYVDVLLVACLKEQVEAREAVLALAGLVARVVDVEAFALARMTDQVVARIAPGRGINSAQWAADAQGLRVACGLALRSFD